MDRREFLRRTAALAASTALTRLAPSQSVAIRAFESRSSMQLHESALAFQQRVQTRDVLLGLDLDRVLLPFRKRAELPAPGEELGGWYSTDAFAPAHAFGQWLSALARSVPHGGDPRSVQGVRDWVNGYAASITADGAFYRHQRFPAYTFDKLVGGLTDAYALTSNEQAKLALERTLVAAEPHLPKHAVPRRETPVLHGEDITEHAWDESYTLAENLFRAYEATHDPRYLAMAKRFLPDDNYFNPLARGENVLPGRHAYSHVNALGSAARAYLVLGEPKYLDAARNGFRFVEEQSYATGGWGPDEHFVEPGSGTLGEGLAREHHSFETPCGAYALFKLARYLLQITGNPHYGDSMERVFYNCALGTLPLHPDGRAFYYSDYTGGAKKGFHPDKWPCCSGTLPMLAQDYAISTFFRTRDALYVNLYQPSSTTWQADGSRLRVEQNGEYPLSEHMLLAVSASAPRTFAIHLRVPEWAKDSARVRVNSGSAQRFSPGSWAELRREWRDGDHIELELPMSNRLVPVDAQHPKVLALMHGPLVLFATKPSKVGPRMALLSARQVNSVEWTNGEQVFRPWFAIKQDEPYSTHTSVSW